MPHPLEQQLEALSQRARKLVWLYGATRLAAIVIGASLLLGLADYLLRPADRGLRFVALGVIVAAAVWCVVRYLQPAWRYRPASIDMARKVELRFPQLGQRLSSAAAFLIRGDQEISPGSPQLQRMLIAETTAAVESLPVAEVFDLSPVKKSLLGFAVVALVGGVLIGLDPVSASVAARRLLVPWSETPWPRRNYLELVAAPSSLARGDALEIVVRDAGGKRLDDVELQWRDLDAPFGTRQTRSMKPLDKQYVARLENVSQSLDFRVVGGDDQNMPWHRVLVVDPPQLKQLSVKITPPAYAGRSPYRAAGQFRILAGSQVLLEGTADRALERAELITVAKPAQPLDGKLSEDGLTFQLPAAESWIPQLSGEYRVRLFEVGQQEVAAEFAYAAEVVIDREPQAVFHETPPSSASASAVLPLQIVLDDDLGVTAARLMIRRAKQPEAAPVALNIFQGEPIGSTSNSVSDADFLSTPWRMQVGYEWRLADIDPAAGTLQAGEELIYYVEAIDGLGQIGRSSERQLNIISAEELNRRLGRRLSEIEAKLAEALRIESEVAAGTEQVELQFAQVGTAGSGDLDQLQSIELRQRQVESLLMSRADSATNLIREALAEIHQNQIEQPATLERLQEYRSVIAQLGQRELPAASRELIASLKQLRADLQLADHEDSAARVSLPAASVQQLVATLSAAHTQEQAVIAALESLLGSLARWSDFHRFAEELSAIRRQQEELLADTLKVRPETIGRDRRGMSAQLIAELDKLALRQRELARRFEQLQGQMEATARDLAAADASTAARLTDVFDEATRRGVAGKLRDSSRHLDANRLGNSGTSQEQAIADMEHLSGMLTGRRETDLAKIADQLRDEADKLDQLASRAAELEKEAAQAGDEKNAAKQQNKLDQLDQERKELAEEVERTRRRLERLEAKEAAEEAAAANEALGGGEGGKSDADGLKQQAAAAKKRLDQARAKLDEKIAQAERDLFHEQIARLEQTLVGLTERERSIRSELDRLHLLRTSDGELTPAQQASVTALAAEQQVVQQETEAAAAGLQEAAVFQLSLAGIARSMGRVVERLEAQQTGEEAQAAADEAIARLQQLSEAIKPEPPPPNDNENQAGNPPDQPPPENNAPPIDGVKLMAEVKLLKLMQLEINRRTLEIEQRRTPQGELSDAQQQELAALAQEQGHLAELFAKIVEAMQGGPAKTTPDAAEQDSNMPLDPNGPEKDPAENSEELEKELDELLKDLG